jgi:hypothetical protein
MVFTKDLPDSRKDEKEVFILELGQAHTLDREAP